MDNEIHIKEINKKIDELIDFKMIVTDAYRTMGVTISKILDDISDMNNDIEWLESYVSDNYSLDANKHVLKSLQKQIKKIEKSYVSTDDFKIIEDDIKLIKECIDDIMDDE